MHLLFVIGKLLLAPVLAGMMTLSMLLAIDGYQVAAIITAFGTFVGVCGGLIIQLRTFKEVKTINSKSLANLADENENRRVIDIPESDRTLEEKTHILDVEREIERKKKL